MTCIVKYKGLSIPESDFKHQLASGKFPELESKISEIDLSPEETKSLSQVSIETLELSTIPLIAPDKFNSGQQEEIINYMTGEVVSYILNNNGKEELLIEKGIESIKEQLTPGLESSYGDNIQSLFDNWKDFSDIVKYRIKSFNIDFESYEEKSIEDEKEGSYEEGRAIMENPYIKIGQELKKRLFTVLDIERFDEDNQPVYKKTLLGPYAYKSINDVLPTILSHTTNSKGEYNNVRGILLNNEIATPWFRDVVELMDSASEQTKIQFARWANKHVVNLKYLDINKKDKQIRFNNSNSGRQTDIVIENWVESLKESELVINKDNQLVIDKTKAKEIRDKFKSLIDEYNQNKDENESLPEIINILGSMGINIKLNELKKMQNTLNSQGFMYNGSRKNFREYFLSSNGPLEYTTAKLTDTVKGKNEFDTNNPLVDNSGIRNLALLYSNHQDTKINDSYKNAENKTIYSYSPGKYSIDQFQKITTDPEYVKSLMTTQFSRNSLWGKALTSTDNAFRQFFIDNFELDYIDAIKDGRSAKTIDNLSDVEQEKFRLSIFDNQGLNVKNPYGKNTRVGYTSYLTMSDKKTLLTARTLLNDVEYDFNTNKISGKTLDKLIEAANSELLRISAFRNPSMDKSTLPEQLKNGGDKLIVFNFLDINQVFNKDGDLNKEYLEEAINEYFNNIVDKKLSKWKDIGAINDKNDINLNKDYIVYATSKVLNTEDKNQINRFIALDYEINTHLNNLNLFQLFVGDSASYWSKNLKSTLINIDKRLAAQIAPGDPLANTDAKDIAGIDGSTYIQLFSQDHNYISESIEYIVQVLDGKKLTASDLEVIKTGDVKSLKEKYPNSFPYMDIESTDAQEYTTTLEHLYNLFHEGKLEDNQYIDLVNKALNEERFTQEDLKIILNPIKPVSFGGDIKSDNSGIFTYYDINYIKTSSFPLIPQLTSGFELDKLRIQMEEIQGKDKDNLKLVRLVHKTGIKVGFPQNLPKVYNSDGSVNKVDFTSTMKVLDRKNYRIQQEVPFKESSKINRGTQPTKLILGDNLDHKFKSGSGKELRTKFIDLNKKLFEANLNILKARLELEDNGSFNIQKLKDILVDEAKTRGYSKNDIDSLTLLDYQNGQFIIPLMFNNSANKFESLLLSLFDNNIRKQKNTGFSSPLGSSVGFKFQNNLEGISKSKMVFIGDYDGENLKPQRIENGVVKGAQVFAPWKFTDNKGNILDINNFILEQDGKRIIDHRKLPKELLQSMGFRIPTQGLNSMAYVEIVGFVPVENGDLLIAPAEFTKQMGSDFDIDKLYSYLYNTNYNKKNGNLTKFSLTQDFYNYEDSVSKLTDTIFDNFFEDIYEDFEEEILDVKYQKAKIKDLQNKILDIQFEVLSDPTIEIQKQILESLGFGELSNLKEKYDSRKEFDTNILSSEYQINKYIAARAGKAGTGYFSTLNTFNSIIQGNDLKYGSWMEDVFIEKKLVISKPGTGLSNNKDNNGNLKSVNIKAYQSAAVDDQKEQILASLNITTDTFYAIGAWLLDGHSQEDITGITKQPIIDELLYQLSLQKDSFKTEPSKSKEIIYSELMSKYVKEGGLSTDDLKNIEKRAISEDKLFDNVFTQDKNKEWYLDQVSALYKFKDADAVGKSLQKVVNAYNVDSSGLGKSFLEAELKLSEFESLSESKTILNIENLENTLGYIVSKTALEPAIKAFSKYFNYLNDYNNSIFQSILDISDKSDLTLGEKETLFRKIHNDMKSAIFSEMVNSQENISEIRRNLLFGDNSLPKRISQLKKETNNPFILKLKTKISPDSTLPDSIEIRSVGGELFDDEAVYIGFLDLFADESTQQIGKDLVDYFYVNGGIQQAREYSKYISVGYLQASGYAEFLRGLNVKDFSNVLGNPELFVLDFFRNNPNYAYQVKPEDLTKINEVEFELSEIVKSKEIIYDGNNLYLKTNVGIYIEIPTLGSKYNYEYGTEYSIYPENKKVDLQIVNKENTKASKEVLIQNTERIPEDFKSLGIKKNNTTKDIINILNSIDSETSKTIASVIENQNIDLSLSLSDINSYGNGKITINKSISSLNELQRVIIHESAHGITSEIINKIIRADGSFNFEGLTEPQKMSFIRLNNILKTFETKIANNEISGFTIEGLNTFRKKLIDKKQGKDVDLSAEDIKYNKFANLKEFIAEAFSNKEFQNQLNSINYKEFQKDKTFLQELIEAIANFINKFKGVNPNSLLAQTLYDGFTLAGYQEKVIEIKDLKNINITGIGIYNNPNDINDGNQIAVLNGETNKGSNLLFVQDLDSGERYEIYKNQFIPTKNQINNTEQKINNNIEKIYSQLGNKTQSKNVILPKDVDPEADNIGMKYTTSIDFWRKIVPEAVALYSKSNPLIVAFRGNSKKTFLENYNSGSYTIGNPFNFMNESGNRKEQGIKATKKFIEWMITGDNQNNNDATEGYRQAIIKDIKSGKIKGSSILYYEEKGYATHATALDYLINKYDWDVEKTNKDFSLSLPEETNDLGMSIQEYLKLLPKENRAIFRELLNNNEIKVKCK